MNWGDYREPKYGIISNNYKPTDWSCHNGLLFSAEYLAFTPDLESQEKDWYYSLVSSCFHQGILQRHPDHDDEPTSYDDFIGITAGLTIIGRVDLLNSIYLTMENKGWHNGKNPLYRFRHMISFMAVASGFKPSWFDRIFISAAFIQNMFEPAGNTSGRIMCALMAKTIKGKDWFLDIIIALWATICERKYSDEGFRECLAIYFKPSHPLAKYGPVSFC